MKSKFAVLIALLALGSFGFVACGDDDDEEPTATETTTTEETTGGGGTAGGSLAFTADPGGGLAYEEDSAETAAGEVAIELTNEAQVPHDVRIEDSSGEDIGGTDEVTGGEAAATVELEAGDYTFYCSVPGHREAGMEGPLTVE